MLTDKDKAELNTMSNTELTTVQKLFRKMADHPLQVTDQPGRLEAVANEATIILNSRNAV